MKLLNVTLLSLFFFQLSFSQTLKYADGTSQNMSNIFVNVNSNQNSNIKGSKYLNEDFISTKISSMPDQIFGVRYNIYDDQMEFQGADNTVYALNKSDDSIVITFTATNESYNIFVTISICIAVMIASTFAIVHVYRHKKSPNYKN